MIGFTVVTVGLLLTEAKMGSAKEPNMSNPTPPTLTLGYPLGCCPIYVDVPIILIPDNCSITGVAWTYGGFTVGPLSLGGLPENPGYDIHDDIITPTKPSSVQISVATQDYTYWGVYVTIGNNEHFINFGYFGAEPKWPTEDPSGSYDWYSFNCTLPPGYMIGPAVVHH